MKKLLLQLILVGIIIKIYLLMKYERILLN